MKTSLDEFVAKQRSNPPFNFWIGYLGMVELLPRFVRTDQDGQWNLHTNSLKEMLLFLCLWSSQLYHAQARSQGCGGCDAPPKSAKGPLLATKWAKNGVFVGG